MEKNKILFSHTSYNIINSSNKFVSSRNAKKKMIFQDLITSCDIGLSTVILRSIYKKINYYFQELKLKKILFYG